MITDDLYKEQLLEEATHPSNRKKLEHYTHCAQYGNASCGDQFTVFLLVEDKVVSAIGWEGSGCAVSTACMSALSKHITGLDQDAIQRITVTEVGKMVGLENISLGRLKCVQTPLLAVKDAFITIEKDV